MKAAEATLQQTLNGPYQYLIPVFQRYYSWKKSNWEELWNNVLELLDPEQDVKSHFMGSLVFVPEEPEPTKVPVFRVIDGQQRIMTLSLLLCALRDQALESELETFAREIAESYLVHPFKKGREHFRVYPRLRDRNAYTDIVLKESETKGQIAAALSYFHKRIAELPNSTNEEELRNLCAVIVSKFEFVQISLRGENQYRIFKSLNSTGVELSEADLIRNFVFMHVAVDDQDSFDDNHWRALEKHFEDASGKLDSDLLSSFFRDYLMSDGKYVSPYATFESFEKTYGVADFDATSLASELATAAAHYDQIRTVSPHPNPLVNAALSKLSELDSSTSSPLVLNLLKRLDNGTVTVEDFVDCIEMTAGFIFRRFICGDQSRGYSRLFVSACKTLNDDPTGDLQEFYLKRSFPNNARFETELVKFPLYESKYANAVLWCLEGDFGHKEGPAHGENIQIEHVMPQTLNADWKKDLGDNYKHLHQQWQHTIGNLTLSAYNPGLWNHSFKTKLNGLGETKGYKDSNFELTKLIAKNAVWGELQIRSRGETLAKRALEIWRGPAEGATPDGKVIDVETGGYLKSSAIGMVYQLLRDGNWHTTKELEKAAAGKANLDGRLYSIGKRGAKRGLWKLEGKNGNYRLQFYAKAHA
jgi:hypothetical protein